jgi:alpha-tubulin suppressor-like RCC1 family protein
MKTPVKLAAFFAGPWHSCALAVNGAAYCWGMNEMGQLGDGSTSNRRNFVAVKTDQRFASLSLGAQFTCGVTLEKRVYCWGANAQGQVGDGTFTGRAVPTAVRIHR